MRNYNIENLIKKYIREYNEKNENEIYFDEPIVGFSKGDDQLFKVIKEDIGKFYWTPLDAFLQEYPKDRLPEDNLTVVSWILPHTNVTKEMQRKEKKYPSKNWVEGKFYGEKLNNNLRKNIVHVLRSIGFKAVAPILLNGWRKFETDKYGTVSSWSERHAAYVSGLGTFGLCDGLITKAGKAHRCGSVIINMKLEPTKREYENHNDYCLYYATGTCKRCIERCPADAISETGHDKEKCNQYHNEVTKPYILEKYNIKSSSCGLCQTDVPCESKIPVNL